MPLSPAQRHQAKHHAIVIAKAAGASFSAGDIIIAPPHPEEGEAAQTYRNLMAQLVEDRRRLSGIASTERKVEAKRDMIDAYQGYVDAVIDAAEQVGKAVQDEIVVTVMIWALDLEQWDYALHVAEHVLTYGLSMPTRFNRDAPTFVVEQVAEAALKAAKLDQDFPRDVLSRVLEMSQPFDILDIVQAKLRKAMGQQLVRIANGEAGQDGAAGMQRHAISAALEMFQSAYRLDPKIGVTKDIEGLKRQLKKLATPDAKDEPAPADPEVPETAAVPSDAG